MGIKYDSNDDLIPGPAEQAQPSFNTPNLSNEGLGNQVNQANQANQASQTFQDQSGRKLYHGRTFGQGLLLGQNIMPTITATRGSEYTNNIAKGLQEIYKALTVSHKPTVTIFDKEKIQGLAYSSIVVSLETDVVRYFVIQLEATGRKSITAIEIMNELTSTTRNPNTRPNIYTADDGIDPTLDTIVRKGLCDLLYPKLHENQLVTVDGVLLHASHPEFETIAADLARLAYNACVADSCIQTQEFKDLDIYASIQANPNAKYTYKVITSKSQSYTELGRPIRADWKVDLFQSIKNYQGNSINLQAQDIPCSRTCGYIDVLPEEFNPQPQGPGFFPTPNAPKITRFHPHVIITSTETTQPTIGYLLLGLVNALLMANQNMWTTVLRPTDPKNNIGVLNIDAKVDGGVGEKLNLASKEYTPERIINCMTQMVSLPPVVSMDIESYGPQTYYSSVISKAASSQNTSEREAARSLIIRRAHDLTGGVFPLDFPTEFIFGKDAIVIPLGKWSDKSGERDIRDIDYLFLANNTDDKQILNQYALSEIGVGYQNLDPYLTKVAIISRFIPSAEIIAKGIRVTFSSLFISKLTEAVTAAGLNVQYHSDVPMTTDQSLSLMSNYFAATGLNGFNAGFATPYSPNQVNYGVNFPFANGPRRY